MPTVMITGAKRGIGRGLVERFLENGWDVIAAGRDATATDLATLGERVTVIDLDVTDPASIEAMVAALAGRAIDLLVNNAGVYNYPKNTLDTVTPEAWLEELSVNTLAPLMVSRALLPNLRAGDMRRLAVISSKMGSIADNTSGGSYMYRSSKAATNAVWRSLSRDLATEGFTCVTLHPGWVQTDMGGGAAPLTVAQSTAGLCKVLSTLELNQNGMFLNYDGTVLPW